MRPKLLIKYKGILWSGGCVVWSNSEEIRHTQGQRRSLSKLVEGAKLHLESNPIPARDAQRAQTNPARTRTQRPHRDGD